MPLPTEPNLPTELRSPEKSNPPAEPARANAFRLPPGVDLPPYAELHCLTNFSFLRGASHPEELVERAAELGYTALAITDRNSLAGVVRAHLAAKEHNLHLLIGAEITPIDGPPIVLFAPDRAAYGRLSRLITCGRRRARKGDCELYLDDLVEFGPGLLAIIVTDELRDPSSPAVEIYKRIFGRDLYLAASVDGVTPDDARLAELQNRSQQLGIPLVATNHVHYHIPDRRYLQDVLTCIRHKCTIHQAGRRLFPNAERHLRPRDEIARRYAACPELLSRTVALAKRCTFSLDELQYQYPHELVPPGRTAMEYLTELTWAGARARYLPHRPADDWHRDELPTRVKVQLIAELEVIAELQYEHYFLTVWDLVRFARRRGILCQGRGSAANSAVCYCLGITAVNPARVELLFERFISRERNEPPDIDVDFEHERREEVFQYIYEKYGRERAAITAEVITYRPRSAVRDVGKALGLSLDRIDLIAKSLDWWSRESVPDDALQAAGLSANDRTVQMLIRLVRQLLGFPRHLSQHVGGFVITETPLCEIVPLENGAMPDRTFIEWDKDDIDALGILKVDCLSLGMLTAIRKCFGLLATNNLSPAPRSLADVPPEDPAVYDMICAADTVGVFQIESRAQMSMLPRLRPRCYYDLVIEVAIVRPGPIQGGMVHPYLRRRNGEEPVTYPSEAVRAVLAKTLGVPLFQEQVMRLAVVAAGFTPGEADLLRRSMAAWRRGGKIEQFRQRVISGMQAGGYSAEFAEQIFEQIRGFGEYGFPESHAASFALLVYVSAWLKRYHPAAFVAAVLNSLPMGFYAPAQLVRDARAHDVEVRGVDVNFSETDCRLERDVNAQSPALRLGYRLVRGLTGPKVEGIVTARGAGRFRSLTDLVRRSGVSRETLLRLAAADAFRSLGLDRRQALWQVLGLDERPLPLFGELEPDEPAAILPETPMEEQVVADYDAVGLSLTAHPIELMRPVLKGQRVVTSASLRASRQGQWVQVAGLVLNRQHPSTAKGIVFMTLEDESGIANLIVRPKVWERYKVIARTRIALIAAGNIERQGEVIHIQVRRLFDLSSRMKALRTRSRDFR